MTNIPQTVNNRIIIQNKVHKVQRK